MDFFDKKAKNLRKQRRQAKHTKIADVISSGDKPNHISRRLTTQNASLQAVAFVRDILSQYRLPGLPKLSYSGVRRMKVAEGSSEVEDGVVTITANFKTHTGVGVSIDIPVEIHEGKLLEPAVVFYNGAPRVIAQSSFDDITGLNTIYEKANTRGMYDIPPDKSADLPIIEKANNGMFSTAAMREQIRKAIRLGSDQEIKEACRQPVPHTERSSDMMEEQHPLRNDYDRNDMGDQDHIDPAERLEDNDILPGMKKSLSQAMEIKDRGGVRYEKKSGESCKIIKDMAGDNKLFHVRFEDGLEAVVERGFLKGAAKIAQAVCPYCSHTCRNNTNLGFCSNQCKMLSSVDKEKKNLTPSKTPLSISERTIDKFNKSLEEARPETPKEQKSVMQPIKKLVDKLKPKEQQLEEQPKKQSSKQAAIPPLVTRCPMCDQFNCICDQSESENRKMNEKMREGEEHLECPECKSTNIGHDENDPPEGQDARICSDCGQVWWVGMNPVGLDDGLVARVNEEVEQMKEAGDEEISIHQAIKDKYGDEMYNAVFEKVGPGEKESVGSIPPPVPTPAPESEESRFTNAPTKNTSFKDPYSSQYQEADPRTPRSTLPSQVQNYGKDHDMMSAKPERPVTEPTKSMRPPKKASKEAGPAIQYLPAMHVAPEQPAGKPKIVVCPGCKTMQPPGKPCTVCRYPDPAKKDWVK